MKKIYSTHIGKVFSLMLAVFIICTVSQKVHATSQIVTLSANGIELTVDLPSEWISVKLQQPYYIMSSVDDVQVVLEIEQSSMKEQEKAHESTYLWIKESEPDTTFFEKLPDITTELGTFEVCSLVYGETKTETSITAFCKLNYRYIYVITLRGEEGVSYELLQKFISATLVSVPYQWDPFALGLTAFLLAVGLVSIIRQIRIKHFGIKTTGVIVGVNMSGKWAAVKISYLLENGEKIEGIHDMIGVVGMYYGNKVGETVEISYLPKKPNIPHILIYKGGYITGIFLVLVATGGICLMMFLL